MDELAERRAKAAAVPDEMTVTWQRDEDGNRVVVIVDHVEGELWRLRPDTAEEMARLLTQAAAKARADEEIR